MIEDREHSTALVIAARVVSCVGLLTLAGFTLVGALAFGWCAGDDCVGWSRFWLLTAGWSLAAVGLAISALATYVLIRRGRYLTHVGAWIGGIVVSWLIWLLTASMDSPL